MTKRRSSLVAVVLVLTVLLGGTFAWNSEGQRAFNVTYYDADTNYGGRIHDDYDGEGAGLHNKDIFAENFGENDLFVRIRLREFLSINGEPVFDGMELNDPTTWPIYVSEPNDVHTPRAGTQIATLHGEEPDGYGIRWELGHRDEKYFMPTFNHAVYRADTIDPSVPDVFAREDAFRMTNATGNAVDAIGTEDRYEDFNLTGVTHVRDILDRGIATGPGDGSHNAWGPDDTHEDYLIYTERDETTGEVELRATGPVTHTAQRTLEPSIIRENNIPTTGAIESVLGLESYTDFVGVMTMANWIALSRPAGNFWILDTDGWFYWNGWLPAGEATSLLLDAIYLPERGNDSWQHAIEVEGDFFTPDSIDGIDMSPEARQIFDAHIPAVDAALNEED